MIWQMEFRLLVWCFFFIFYLNCFFFSSFSTTLYIWVAYESTLWLFLSVLFFFFFINILILPWLSTSRYPRNNNHQPATWYFITEALFNWTPLDTRIVHIFLRLLLLVGWLVDWLRDLVQAKALVNGLGQDIWNETVFYVMLSGCGVRLLIRSLPIIRCVEWKCRDGFSLRALRPLTYIHYATNVTFSFRVKWYKKIIKKQQL